MSHSSVILLKKLIPVFIISGFLYMGITAYSLLSLRSNEVTVIPVKQMASIIQDSVKKDLSLKVGKENILLRSEEIGHWVEPYVRDYSGEEDLRLSIPKISAYLETIAPRFNISPVDAKLRFTGNRADIFTPSINGQKLMIAESASIIALAIQQASPSAELLFEVTEPDITLKKINDLGINTLLGRGESDYGKSSISRITNIKIGLSKFNGVILKPGEEFSFNDILGEVEEKDGYRAELVIKNGGLIKEFGGGLCQVATTVFRAAILSGLEITERKPHSFSVQYYNPQGFDATIYPGIVNLRFINNTGNHLLVQAKLIGSRLQVDMYGSNDGKEVKMEGPVQYAKQPSGAMKAYFIRRIYKDNKLEKEERFDSSYEPHPPTPVERNPLE